MSSSNSYNWFLDNAGIITEAFGRCGIHPTALTREHFISATRSLNLALAAWSNRGINLWQVDLQSIPLVQGIATYYLPSNTVNILDAYIETYFLPTTFTGPPEFTAVPGSNLITITIPQHDLTIGNWIDIITQIAINGIVLEGLYQVTNVLNPNQITITAGTATGSSGIIELESGLGGIELESGTGQIGLESTSTTGVLPVFTATSGSSVVSVFFPSHGLVAGETFDVPEPTLVGGLPLSGGYGVETVVDANTFTFDFAVMDASSTETITLNYGNVVINTQANSSDPIDRIMTSISRTDYAAIPDKGSQAPPSVFWFDRLSPIPTVNIWNVPDGNGPYMFFYYRMRRVQDAYATSGQTADIPYLFLDALCADMASRLARKYAPALLQSFREEAQEAWTIAAEENRERVQLFLCPDTSGYFR